MSATGENRNLAQWCAAHAWAVTTESDCNGYPPRTDERFALYDANEDDPPIALFSFREDAEAVADALTQFGAGSTEEAP